MAYIQVRDKYWNEAIMKSTLMRSAYCREQLEAANALLLPFADEVLQKVVGPNFHVTKLTVIDGTAKGRKQIPASMKPRAEAVTERVLIAYDAGEVPCYSQDEIEMSHDEFWQHVQEAHSK